MGAGAAGGAAAFHLANANKEVVILEKDDFPRRKPCGGGMAASVQEYFPFSLQPVIEEIISSVEFSWFLSDEVIAELPGSSPFWIVRRENLDNFLIEKAISKGAKLLKPFNACKIAQEKNHWIINSENNQTIKTRSIVIADGSNSQWSKVFNLGPKNLHFASTTSVRLNGRGSLKEGTARFEFGLVKHGFAWAFPLRGNVNIGVGTFIGKNSSNSDAILEQLLPNLGFAPGEGERTSSSLRVWNGHNDLHSNGIVAVGDAASLCDPFLAEGLRPALMSGCQAAKHLNLWLEGRTQDLSGYTKAIKLEWGDSMAWGRRISQVFYRFPKVGYQLGIKRPTAPERIAQILSGKMSYEDIAQRVIKRLIFQR
ncbi:Geranylgeranyl reductase [Prochlorococcus sp. MIT 0601]|nr:Geranylgeranyl reductase [Prochlorococcus sp. MIT 0601]